MTQPNPTQTAETPTYLYVIADIRERAAVGLKTYGTYLQPHNGRDSLLDAYEEALDLAIYIQNELLRREGEQRRIEELTRANEDLRETVAELEARLARR